MKYVVIRIEPSAADIAKVKLEIDQIYSRIVRGEDFGELAKACSEDPGSATNGGDLGEFGKGMMVREFEQAAFALRPGEVSQPVRTSFGWHLIRCESRSGTPSEPKIRARHILLMVEPSDATREALLAKAMAVREEIPHKGIEAVATDHGLKLRDSGLIAHTETSIPDLGKIPGLMSFLRGGQVGAVSEIERDYERNLIIAQLTETKPVYYESYEEVEFKIAFELEKQKKCDLALSQASEFLRRNQGKDLLQAAEEQNLQVIYLKNFRSGSVPEKIGVSPEFTKAALELNTGEMSEPVMIPVGSVIILAGDCRKPDLKEFMKDPSKQKEVREHLIDAAFNRWFNEIEAEAEVRDYRYRYGF